MERFRERVAIQARREASVGS
jgi:hypothetical protein